jgi:hypothetical protein
MLLPALALEYVTGAPATFVQSQVKYYRSRNAITGGRVGVLLLLPGTRLGTLLMCQQLQT